MASSYQLVPTTGSASAATDESSKIQSRHVQHPVVDTQEEVKEGTEELAHKDTPEDGKRPRVPKDSRIKLVGRKLSVSLTDSWTIEIASLVTSVALLIGLAILFHAWDGSPTAGWTSGITLPTVIAVLSKASQVTLVLPVASSLSQLGWLHFRRSRALIDFQKFDAASRSPLGNLLLLFSAPSWYAMLGVLIMIPALGFEAATQQCLEIQAPANIPVVAQIYGLDTYASIGGLVTDGLRDAGMMAMATRTAAQPGGSVPPYAAHGNSRTQTVLPQALIYSCSTPGCGPAPYATLAFCSKCDDITQELLLTCDDGAGSACPQLPNGAGLQRSDQVLAITSTPVAHNYSATWKGELLLANFSMVEFFGPPPGSTYVQPVPHAAQLCSVRLCTNIYQLNAATGDTGTSGATEALLASITQAESVGPGALENGRTGWTIPVPDGTPLRFPQGGVGEWNGDPTTIWGMDSHSLPFIADYFVSLFNGTSFIGASDGTSVVDALTYAQQPAGNGFWDSIAHTLVTYGYSDLNDVTSQVDGAIANIVNSMGNWARNFYYDTGADQPGQPIYSQLILENTYRIRWPWLILPVVLDLLAIWLLLGTILETRRHRFPIWKTSTIAIMFHGIAQSDAAATPEIRHRDETASAMEELAVRKRVKLISTPRGYRLVDAESEATHGDQ